MRYGSRRHLRRSPQLADGRASMEWRAGRAPDRRFAVGIVSKPKFWLLWAWSGQDRPASVAGQGSPQRKWAVEADRAAPRETFPTRVGSSLDSRPRPACRQLREL